MQLNNYYYVNKSHVTSTYIMHFYDLKKQNQINVI